MSFDKVKYQGFDVDGLVPPHVQALLKGFPAGISLPAYRAIEPLVPQDLMLELLATYQGEVGVLRTMQDFLAKGSTKLNPEGTARAVANAVRRALLCKPVGGFELDLAHDNAKYNALFEHKPVKTGPVSSASHVGPDANPVIPPGSAPMSGVTASIAPAHVQAAVKEDRATKYYPCKVCQAQIEGIVPLYLHHINDHNGKWAFPKINHLPVVKQHSGKYVVSYYDGEFKRVHGRPPSFAVPPAGSATPVVQTCQKIIPMTGAKCGGTMPCRVHAWPGTSTAGTVSSTFVPKYDIDLRLIPDGRFAVKKAGLWIFLIKTTSKHVRYRAGRFVWGRASHRSQSVPAGTIELRLQSGDTKRLIGEQRVGESVYYGELEDDVKEIMRDPVEAMQQYGRIKGVCAHCGRSLTDEVSRMRGIGPDCWTGKHLSFARSPRTHLAVKS